jgi:two-component system, chemotaxis family, protein-glutamate methylesterase/glutaminase
MADRSDPIRVLVIDDSLTARSLLVNLVQNTEGMQVVGMGADGEEALRLTRRLKPDVVLMDIRMPNLDGLEATRRIMREMPTRIIIVSGSMRNEEVELTFQALRAGALAVLHKPGLSDPETCAHVLRTVQVMADVPVIHHWGRAQKVPSTRATVAAKPVKTEGGILLPLPLNLQKANLDVICIAASTGGPAALAQVLAELPLSYPLPIVLVQHISLGFAGGLANWLASVIKMRVEVPAHGDSIHPGVVYLAPDDYHLRVAAKGIIELNREEPYKGLRPSANYLFESAGKAYGEKALGVILTGMGDDGADGMARMHESGSLTIAQDEETSVVYGMPHEASLRGAVDFEMPLDQIAYSLQEIGRIHARKERGQS